MLYIRLTCTYNLVVFCTYHQAHDGRTGFPIFQKSFVNGVMTSKIEYDVPSTIIAFIGVNNMPLNRKDRHPELKYKLESVM